MLFWQTTIFQLLIGIIWGVTNILIKYASESKTESKNGNKKSINWKVLIPFLVNQSGSVGFAYSLGYSSLLPQSISDLCRIKNQHDIVDISLAVPFTNSVTFTTSALFAHHFYNEKIGLQGFFGLVLISIGLALCCSA